MIYFTVVLLYVELCYPCEQPFNCGRETSVQNPIRLGCNVGVHIVFRSPTAHSWASSVYVGNVVDGETPLLQRPSNAASLTLQKICC